MRVTPAARALASAIAERLRPYIGQRVSPEVRSAIVADLRDLVREIEGGRN